ncbi:unnamed protein product [Protopolystoma xenopodis]|uniref:Uncharacterized protein n=1 Tax=Protopolystoma xenopodis TaxID=117903 RepID=A0A3S5AXF3_9PLAT|nr:unnamed protein product [Protopolystoma xenopodis]
MPTTMPAKRLGMYHVHGLTLEMIMQTMDSRLVPHVLVGLLIPDSLHDLTGVHVADVYHAFRLHCSTFVMLEYIYIICYDAFGSGSLGESSHLETDFAANTYIQASLPPEPVAAAVSTSSTSEVSCFNNPLLVFGQFSASDPLGPSMAKDFGLLMANHRTLPSSSGMSAMLLTPNCRIPSGMPTTNPPTTPTSCIDNHQPDPVVTRSMSSANKRNQTSTGISGNQVASATRHRLNGLYNQQQSQRQQRKDPSSLSELTRSRQVPLNRSDDSNSGAFPNNYSQGYSLHAGDLLFASSSQVVAPLNQQASSCATQSLSQPSALGLIARNLGSQLRSHLTSGPALFPQHQGEPIPDQLLRDWIHHSALRLRQRIVFHLKQSSLVTSCHSAVQADGNSCQIMSNLAYDQPHLLNSGTSDILME